VREGRRETEGERRVRGRKIETERKKYEEIGRKK
jgi:hypothetical protein